MAVSVRLYRGFTRTTCFHRKTTTLLFRRELVGVDGSLLYASEQHIAGIVHVPNAALEAEIPLRLTVGSSKRSHSTTAVSGDNIFLPQMRELGSPAAE